MLNDQGDIVKMGNNMTVSVIVPIYKTEPYIRKCIDSIMNQTYTYLEIILIDDGSPDQSGAICDEYAKRDGRVRVIHKENGGLSDARNVGIDSATGEYLMFVDSDDYIAPDMTEVLLKALVDNGADMSLCSYIYIDENEVEIPERIGQSPVKREVLTREQALEKLAEPRYWYYVVAWAKLYKRELFQTIHFPKGKIHEDEFVMHYLIGKCQKVACVPEAYYWYVQHQGSIMSNRNALSYLYVGEAYLDRALFLSNCGLNAAAGKMYVKSCRRIGLYYKRGKDDIVINESAAALQLLRDNAFLQSCCTLNEKAQAKLICFNPRLYQFLRRFIKPKK